MEKIIVTWILWQLDKKSVNRPCGRSKCLSIVLNVMFFATQIVSARLEFFSVNYNLVIKNCFL